MFYNVPIYQLIYLVDYYIKFKRQYLNNNLNIIFKEQVFKEYNNIYNIIKGI